MALNYFGIGIILVLCILTWNRTKVWADSVTLWTDVMNKNPKCMSAYINRSYMYLHYKQYDKVMKDCNDGLNIDSTQHKLYINRGIAYRETASYKLARQDFSTVIRINPESYEAYLDRGILYTDRFNKYDSGIADFRYYLKFRPNDKNGHFNMAVALYKSQQYDSALVFLRTTLELAPDFSNAYYILALVYAAKLDFVKAYENGAQAQSMGLNIDKQLMENWRKNANVVIPDFK
jgi:tetratricopeptide (TPR) repeat protein